MAERGKTIICSVLFLDIAEYSKKSVSGQISLKERFNAYLSVAIRDVPIDDRIILDTGDGAALSFLGDVGDALQVALSMRESLREGLHMEPPLLVRMGINLGPVRLIRDINGQPNIVGDGINVSQRVMGFADPGQILVSRTYYDAVSRLSPEYAGMFHYQGSRTDKHVREHEIYAIGYPGEFTSTLTLSGEAGRSKSEKSSLSRQLSKSWRNAVAAFRQTSSRKRMAYGGAALVSVIAVITVFTVMVRRPAAPPHPAEVSAQLAASSVAPIIPASTVVASISASAVAPASGSAAQAGTTAEQEARKKAAARREKALAAKRKKLEREKAARKKTPERTPETAEKGGGAAASGQATLTVICGEGASVYVDAQLKGKVGRSPLTIRLDVGKHFVLVMYASRVYSKHMAFAAGKTVKVSPDICHPPAPGAE